MSKIFTQLAVCYKQYINILYTDFICLCREKMHKEMLKSFKINNLYICERERIYTHTPVQVLLIKKENTKFYCASILDKNRSGDT